MVLSIRWYLLDRAQAASSAKRVNGTSGMLATCELDAIVQQDVLSAASRMRRQPHHAAATGRHLSRQSGIYIYIYIYIHREREGERERKRVYCVYIYIYIYALHLGASQRAPLLQEDANTSYNYISYNLQLHFFKSLKRRKMKTTNYLILPIQA